MSKEDRERLENDLREMLNLLAKLNRLSQRVEIAADKAIQALKENPSHG